MDFNGIIKDLKEDIRKRNPQIPEKIIEEYINLIFWGAKWATYCGNKEIYILGIAESKYDFYYVGCNENYEIELISCALEVKKNKERENDYITKFQDNSKRYSKECDNIWRIIRKNIKEYFENNKQYKLLEWIDYVLNDEHIVYDNEDHTEYHIEKYYKNHKEY